MIMITFRILCIFSLCDGQPQAIVQHHIVTPPANQSECTTTCLLIQAIGLVTGTRVND